MSSLISWAAILLSLALCPLFSGFVDRMTAFFAGRDGDGMLQPYRDLLTLARKRGRRVMFIDGVIPAGVLTASCLLLFTTPLGTEASALSFPGDFALWMVALASGRTFGVAAAFGRSGFPGFGAGRLAIRSTLVCITAFAALATILAVGDGTSLAAALEGLTGRARADYIVALLAASFAFAVATLAESGKAPFDDLAGWEPKLAHDAVERDFGGPELAMLKYAEHLKLWTLGCMAVQIALPRLDLDPLDAARVFAGLAVFGALAGLAGAFAPRLDGKRSVLALGAACALAVMSPFLAWIRI
ncbi:MAG: NADH-quinone oxidoreductase subunit H [Planctomycetota bacterium]|nr:NADH-quinone oxidoreductase subunit H [Planctomycetota bacterium]